MAVITIIAQIFAVVHQYNYFLNEHNQNPVDILHYLKSGHFIEATFENWESEFLSVFAIIFLSIYLREIGSPQSKPVDAPNSETEG